MILRLYLISCPCTMARCTSARVLIDNTVLMVLAWILLLPLVCVYCVVTVPHVHAL